MRKNLSVQKRIVLAFSLITLLVFLSSGIGYWYIEIIEKQIQNNQREIEKLNSIRDLEESWFSLIISIDEIIITHKTADYLDVISAQIELFNRNVKELPEYLPQNTANPNEQYLKIINRIQVNGQDAVAIVEEIIQNIRENRWAQAINLRTVRLAIVQQELISNINQLRDMVTQNVEVSAFRVENSKNFGRYFWIVAAVVALIEGSLLAYFTTRSISQPMKKLIHDLKRVTQNDFSPLVTLPQNDEIGELSRGLGVLTDWLRESYEGLETRIKEGTRELERSNLQIRAAAEVVREATSANSLNEMLLKSVEAIKNKYGYYYAGIYINDDINEFTYLKAAAGEYGRQLVERGHKLRIGTEGIVGYVAKNGHVRITDDVQSDEVYHWNPLLPETRSEICLPLKSGDFIFGVLDIQSNYTFTFNENIVLLLQIIADQLSISIENMQLFEELQTQLKELDLTHSQYKQASWRYFLSTLSCSGFQYDQNGLSQVGKGALHDSTSDCHENYESPPPISIPIDVNNQSIGQIDIWVENNNLSETVREQLHQISQRLGQTIEAARLFQQSRNRSEQVRLLGEITTKMHETLDIDQLLQTTAIELQKILELSEVEVRLIPSDPVEAINNHTNE